ncbi:MAG: SAM-dependent methyltransferase [Patescibacteria group bacterium]
MYKITTGIGLFVSLLFGIYVTYNPQANVTYLIAAFVLIMTTVTIVGDIWTRHYFKNVGFGAYYVPSENKTVKKMVKLAEPKSGMKIADLGSGDGKVVISMAKKGAEVHGYEIDPYLALISKIRVKLRFLGNKATIHKQSYWDVTLSEYNVITLFGIPYIMEKLEKKLLKELKPGTKIISNKFKFPNLEPVKIVDDIFVYVV